MIQFITVKAVLNETFLNFHGDHYLNLIICKQADIYFSGLLLVLKRRPYLSVLLAWDINASYF